MVRIVSAVIVAAFLSGTQSPAQQPPSQPRPATPTVAAPKTPPAQRPAASRPPAEQQPAPTPTPTSPDPPPPGMPAIPPVQEHTPPLDPDQRTALVLLDRIQTLVDEALQEKPGKPSKSGAVGTSGSPESKVKPGKVLIDRAALAEIRAEVAQIKLMLQTRRQAH